MPEQQQKNTYTHEYDEFLGMSLHDLVVFKGFPIT